MAEEDLGWCQAGISRTDSQILSCIPGHAAGQKPHERFSNSTTKGHVCMMQLVSLCKELLEMERWQRGTAGWGDFVTQGLGREGTDFANWSLHYHYRNLVAVVQFAEATPSCFSQKAPCVKAFF